MSISTVDAPRDPHVPVPCNTDERDLDAVAAIAATFLHTLRAEHPAAKLRGLKVEQTDSGIAIKVPESYGDFDVRLAFLRWSFDLLDFGIAAGLRRGAVSSAPTVSGMFYDVPVVVHTYADDDLCG